MSGIIVQAGSVSDWLLAAPWIVVFAAVVYRFATRRPRLGDYPPAIPGPLVSVVIPARNEARNIERCVRSVLAGAYAAVEVIVVDDRSSDDTSEIVERLAASPEARGRLRLVRGVDLPAGWFGKQWALVQGYRAARGELLLFTDADTTHQPDLLPRALAALRAERVDLLSVIPRQETVTFWEKLVQPHVFLALQARVGDLRWINRTRTSWNAIANGQFILATRASYETVGTHEAVKGSVVDDLMLAQTYVRHGRDIFLAHAAEYMSTRMYGSLREIVDGWSKNLALGAPLMAPPIPLVRALFPYVMWVPSLFWLGPPVLWAAQGWAFAAIATGVSLATWIAIYAFEKVPVAYAPLYPIGVGIVAYIMLRSAWRGGRRVEWRGRCYKV